MSKAAAITAALKAEVEAKSVAVVFKATAISSVADTTMTALLYSFPSVANEMEIDGTEANNEDIMLEDVTLVENEDSVMEILTVSLTLSNLCLISLIRTLRGQLL